MCFVVFHLVLELIYSVARKIVVVGDIAYNVPLIVSVFLIQRECNHSIDVVPECCQFMFHRVV